GDAHHAVRVVAPEVGPDQAGGDDAGIRLGHAGGGEQAGHELGQDVRAVAGHLGAPGAFSMKNPILRGDGTFAIRSRSRSNGRRSSGPPARGPDSPPRSTNSVESIPCPSPFSLEESGLRRGSGRRSQGTRSCESWRTGSAPRLAAAGR